MRNKTISELEVDIVKVECHFKPEKKTLFACLQMCIMRALEYI